MSQENSFNQIIDASYVDTGSIIGYTTAANDNTETISFSVSLPFIGRSSDKDRSFLQTGFFTKNLTVTVNYNSCGSGPLTQLDIIPLLHDKSATTDAVSTVLSTKLSILSHIITDTEKNFIKQNIINRVINTSSGIVTNDIEDKKITLTKGLTPVEIDLDSIDINVTHLLFCLNVNIFQATNAPKQFLKGTSNVANISPTNLKSASSGAYVIGDNKLSSTWGKAGIDSNKSVASVVNPDGLGVFNGWLDNAELVLGTETTGKIPCSALSSNQTGFKLMNIEENFYILKLADNAFSTAGVPFSRIKNKKLILNVRNRFFNISTVVNPTAATVATATVATPIGPYVDTKARDATISVCACGTTLQIINNNTISFSYI
jgi:hypothetical protein